MVGGKQIFKSTESYNPGFEEGMPVWFSLWIVLKIQGQLEANIFWEYEEVDFGAEEGVV
ncbi:hypothetical protein L195_g063256 [Trifolium pratense]|uniref:Uncharacterized protein n=1 Tax=Trifolium pratense TaxID=57577 RepID=A0A2K3KKR5_TRIPR|nr:hypothetical protein L195_g063256 [Trifolium pratense]